MAMKSLSYNECPIIILSFIIFLNSYSIYNNVGALTNFSSVIPLQRVKYEIILHGGLIYSSIRITLFQSTIEILAT